MKTKKDRSDYLDSQSEGLQIAKPSKEDLAYLIKIQDEQDKQSLNPGRHD